MDDLFVVIFVFCMFLIMRYFSFSFETNNHLIAEKCKEEEKHENMKKVNGWQFFIYNENLESCFLSQLIEEHMVRKIHTFCQSMLLYEVKISDRVRIIF